VRAGRGRGGDRTDLDRFVVDGVDAVDAEAEADEEEDGSVAPSGGGLVVGGMGVGGEEDIGLAEDAVLCEGDAKGGLGEGVDEMPGAGMSRRWRRKRDVLEGACGDAGAKPVADGGAEVLAGEGHAVD